MEKIIIKNFLIFDDVEMPIRRLNILIGEQASGKSLLAKLVYFFKNIDDVFFKSIFEGMNYKSFLTELEKKFLDYFPMKYWNLNQDFSIEYIAQGKYKVVLEYKSTAKETLFNFCDSFEQLYVDCLQFYISNKETSWESNSKRSFNDIAQMVSKQEIEERIKAEGISDFLETSLFIPAGRSFYSLLENNSFLLLGNNNINIDPTMKDFGAFLQTTKDFINRVKSSSEGEYYLEAQVEHYFKKILKGHYQKINGEDWIIGDNSRVSLSHASSGQQESFPMMLILTSLIGESIKLATNNLIIEEPEAHLFPQAQNSVVSAILYIMSQTDTNFFITTHSPYILTALNNSIFAQELIKKGKLTQEQFIKMSDGAYPIDFDDISAYSLNNGRLINIKDSEYKMLGGEILDQVSNDFGDIFNQLLELDN